MKMEWLRINKGGIVNKEGMISLLGGLFLLFLFLFGLAYLSEKTTQKYIDNGYTKTTLPGFEYSVWVKQ